MLVRISATITTESRNKLDAIAREDNERLPNISASIEAMIQNEFKKRFGDEEPKKKGGRNRKK